MRDRKQISSSERPRQDGSHGIGDERCGYSFSDEGERGRGTKKVLHATHSRSPASVSSEIRQFQSPKGPKERS